MLFKGIDKLGDWNPQLLRELKGRLKGRNIAIAVGASVLGYLAMFLYGLNQLTRLSGPDTYPYIRSTEIFCKLRDSFLANQDKLSQLQEQYRSLQDQLFRYSSAEYFDLDKINQLKGSIADVKTKITHLQRIETVHKCPQDAIDIPLWWQYQHGQMFAWLSVIVLFILLIVGTYMLIADLAGEERRGTLNFIRVSPQSAQSILFGKLLGVPILLYLAAILLIPLQLWLGLSAQIPLGEIFSFYAVLIAGCAFFYSAALLFGLMSSWLNGFQAWLGGGAVLVFLLIAFNKWTWITQTPLDWMKLFSPNVVLPYLYNQTEYYSPEFMDYSTSVEMLQWFNIPVGLTGLGMISFALVNYALWTGWIWQALKRRFQNPNTAILSKRQSYWLVACVEILVLGFAVQEKQDIYISYSLLDHLWIIFCFNAVLFLGLIAALSSHRQVLQDWARYRQQQGKNRKQGGIVQDLIWGEKSPAIVAIGINLAIATTPFWLWISLWNEPGFDKLKALLAVAFFICITLICATLAQLILMMKTPKRSLWATGTIGAVLILPSILLLVLGVEPSDNPIPWLFSSFPWAGIEYAATSMMALALLSECLIWGLLTVQLTRQLHKAGESATQALLAGHSSSRR
ncbi:MAG: ABC transporter permease subunit [Coleofasciculus sp. B1-GNL1-01]|uniref:ABC transporter permease n=1 Tax=Coleofasciculus sp. B1-GNL1-01 TaxID=3068484 RepID=UPI0032F4C486